MQGKRKFWDFIKNDAGNSGELYLYSEIADSTWWGDEVTPLDFKADLDGLGEIDSLDVHINSPGGDVFAGQAIYSMLKRCKAQVNVYIDGLAASVASVVAMAGDQIFIPDNAMMMIHNAWTIAQGNAADLRKCADDMDKVNQSIKAVYLARAKDLDEAKLTDLMDAETWLSAQECVDYGLADQIEEPKEYAASLRGRLFSLFQNIPEDLSDLAKAEPKPDDPEKLKQLKAKLALEIQI